MTVDDTLVTIRFVDESRLDVFNFAATSTLLQDYAEPFAISPDFWCFRLENGLSGKSAAAALSALPEVAVAHPSYLSADHLHLFLTDRIVMRFEAGTNANYIDSLLDVNGLVPDTAEMHRPGVYVVNKASAASGETLELANAIYSGADVMYCHPDFVAEIVRHGVPNDEFFAYQWNFHNTGQSFGTPDADIDAVEAWEITVGDPSMVIALIDDGLQYHGGYQHPDLDYSRILPGYDFAGDHPKYITAPDDDPSPCSLYTHGMACAGLILARQNNSEGMTGLAPGIRLRPIKIFAGSTTSEECFGLGRQYFSRIAGAIAWAAGSDANIFSCSWGMPPNDDVATEIVYAYLGGKAMFFSAGNESHNAPDGVAFPA